MSYVILLQGYRVLLYLNLQSYPEVAYERMNIATTYLSLQSYLEVTYERTKVTIMYLNLQEYRGVIYN